MSAAYSSEPTPETEPTPNFSWPQLARLLGTIAHAMSRDDSRYNLRGVYLERDGAFLVATATDGHRLAQARAELPLDLGDKGRILSADDVARILSEAKRLAKSNRGLAESGGIGGWDGTALRLGIVSEESTLVLRPIDGEFPNYRQVIPAEDKLGAPVWFNGAYLAQAAAELGKLAPKRLATPIKIRLSVLPDGRPNALAPCRIDAIGDEIEAFTIIMPQRP
jgi:DNA polymerase-3 subunit beta